MMSAQLTQAATGGNSGIGLALCKLLATEHGCYVYLGSRSAEKGASRGFRLSESENGQVKE